MTYKIIGLLVMISLLFFACGEKAPQTPTEKPTVKKTGVIKDYEKIEQVKEQIKKFAPVEIDFPRTGLSENQLKALELLVKAARLMDDIFLTQVYSKNEELLAELKKKGNPDYQALLENFKINVGPFDRLEHHKPFINQKEKKPKGANYYPADMTKEEFEAHIKANPADEKAFTSEFTVIRRKEGKLVAIPYSEFYKKHLEPAAKLLKEAAVLIENPSLKKYLNSRADAFLSNDYYQSDVDWVLLKDHKIEIVIGPYEVYEDELLGYKAAFECFITLVDPEESKRLDTLGKYMDDMERNFPVEDKYKNFKRGKFSPIVVTDEVFAAGDTKAGVQTIAFNLPNNEQVRENTGSKKVMLRNVCKAKFKTTWTPIAKEMLTEDNFALASFDAFFFHILMHEISHALGPANIVLDGKETTVSKALKDLYSRIEEAKADTLGIYNLQFMLDKGVFPKELQKNIYATYLGGIFRSLRFGINEAHGASNAIQLNYILEKGGFKFDKTTGKFSVVEDKIRDAIKELATEILMIQALGDYDKAKAMIDKYVKISPELEAILSKMTHVPNDIRPVYAIDK